MFDCPRTPDGSLDPSEFLALAKPEIRPSNRSSSVFALSSVSGVAGSFSRQFGLLSGSAVGTPLSFEAVFEDGVSVGGTQGAGSLLAEPASHIDVLLKTPAVYIDSTAMEVKQQFR